MAVKKKEKKDAMAVINRQIDEGSFARLYLLYGDERYLVNQYRDKLLSALTDTDDNLNFMRFAGAGIDTTELVDFCSELPFFADRRVALVEGSGLFKSSNEELAGRLARIPDTSVIIFAETDVDLRYKLFKTVDKEGEALEFTTPDEKMMVTWVRSLFRTAGVKITDRAIYRLIEVSSMDMNTIKNESDKLIAYADESGETDEDAVNLLCSQSMESRVYQMTDHIIAGRKTKACAMYHDLLMNRESVIMINSVIMRQFNRLLIIKMAAASGKADADIAKLAGCPGWAVKNYRAQCKGYTLAALKDIIEDCQELDYKLKTGQTVGETALELMIVKLCERG